MGPTGLYECKIVNKRYLSKDQFVFDLESMEIAEECRPGQFVNVLCDSLLRRPVSICGVDRKRGIFQIAIRIKGSGTIFLEKKQIGESLSVLGPLGNGFDLSGVTSLVAVGGGIGIYPLLFLLREAKSLGMKTTTVCGFRSKEDSFCIDEITAFSDHMVFASDCGDMEVCGTAIDALQKVDLTNTTVFACGPVPMMREAGRIAFERGVECQVSLEERMGCGTGICLVCACKIKAEESRNGNESSANGYEYKRCCKDGPGFNAKEVAWESI